MTNTNYCVFFSAKHDIIFVDRFNDGRFTGSVHAAEYPTEEHPASRQKMFETFRYIARNKTIKEGTVRSERT